MLVCSNCQTLNPTGVLFCSKCKAPLSLNSASGNASQTPFEDYLPAWMQNGPSAISAPPAAKSALPTSSSGFGFSLDELLQATEAATPTAVQAGGVATTPRPAAPTPPPPALPPPPPFELSIDDLVNARSGSSPGTATVTPPGELPLPGFNEPPLWGRPATGASWQAKDRPEPTGHSAYSSPNGTGFAEASPGTPPKAVKGENWGVEKGFYFYTDEEGQIVLHELAGFLRRFAAAIVDGILVIVLLLVFNLTIGSYIVGTLEANGGNKQEFRQALAADDLNAAERSFADLQTFALLAESSLDMCVSILYYVTTVVLLGGTIGHNLLGICVKSRSSGNVKLFGATVRAVYGSVPNIVQLILLPDILSIMFSIAFAGALFGSSAIGMSVIGALMAKLAAALTITLLFEVLVIVGFLWAIFDKGHQGWHDKLAGTYVVRKDPS